MILLLGCAPPGVLPPPVPFAATDAGQVGIAGSVIDAVGAPRPRRPSVEKFQGQIWTELRLSDRTHLGFVASVAGLQGMQGAGVLVRYQLRDEGTRVVLDFSGGLAWAGLGVGISRRFGPLDLYAAPQVLAKDRPWFKLPIGVSVPLDRFRLTAETGMTTSTSLLASDHPYGPMAWGYVTVGASVAWARKTR